MHDALNAWGRLGTFQQVTPKSARTKPGEPVLARFEGWHQRRPPAVRFGSFVSFRVWSSVQPQNVALRHFGTFEDLGRRPATFGPRVTPCPCDTVCAPSLNRGRWHRRRTAREHTVGRGRRRRSAAKDVGDRRARCGTSPFTHACAVWRLLNT